MPLAELQSEWVADVIEGRVRLPDRPTMMADIASEQAAMRKRYVASKRHTIQVDGVPYKAQLKNERKLYRVEGSPAGPLERVRDAVSA